MTGYVGTMDFPARAVNCFLGLALGDAYGRPMEFERGEAMRRVVVDTARLRWTDDTHMSLYLAQAVAAHGPGPLDDDRLGHAVGTAFLRWEQDPLTPSTAPGNTCLAGVRNYARSRDWRSSGVASSDGCGAVMRVGPLPMRFAGAELDRAAEVSSVVTHAHPNAVDSAVAACRIVRALLDGQPLDEELVRGVAGHNLTGEALRAALEHGVDERRIPPGDGGWRSPSALALGVAAALAGRDFAHAIDLAARIDGDSDSTACIAGMILGASGAALPESWLAGLQARGDIEAAARSVATG